MEVIENIENIEIPVDKRKQNMINFINKNSEKLKVKTCCPICAGSYTYFNKSMHVKTKRHLKMLEMKSNNKVNIII